jgi:hypothetical protein
LGSVVVPCASAGEPVCGAAEGFAALPVAGEGFVCGISIPSIPAGVGCGEGDGIGICIGDGLGVGDTLGVGDGAGICIPSISAGVACGEGDGDGDGIGICIGDGLGFGEGFGVGDGAGIRIPGIDCLSRSCAPDCVAKMLTASSAMAAQRVKIVFTT